VDSNTRFGSPDFDIENIYKLLREILKQKYNQLFYSDFLFDMKRELKSCEISKT